ncbi:MAG: hypothetical protein ACTHK7_08570 [Aureliella sp.]
MNFSAQEVARRKNRRTFFAQTGTALAAASVGNLVPRISVADEPAKAEASAVVAVELPRLRVPMSFIIDDSTSLVNMGRFCMPQFKTAWPDRSEYDKPWQSWPAEIPDDFLRRFGQWCAEHHVRGKFSMVPYPACVGWLDRELPGWSRKQLEASLKLVRELMVPNWDVHPEMITHTRVIDIKTGRPMADINAGTMENSFPQEDKSVDELASYLAYALRILKNCDLPCEGITTPGGFGNRVKDKLPLAVFEAVRDVYGTDLPHYFKYVSEGDQPCTPKLEGVREPDSEDPRVTVNVPAGTGDWFGGWDGSRKSEGERYANRDATSGRMVELVERGEPAIMLCHWPGLYGNGSEEGFQQFEQVVMALEQRYADRARWMKISQIGRYWAAKELTKIGLEKETITFQAPYACDDFTVRLKGRPFSKILWHSAYKVESLIAADSRKTLEAGQYWRDGDEIVVCFNLLRGKNYLEVV